MQGDGAHADCCVACASFVCRQMASASSSSSSSGDSKGGSKFEQMLDGHLRAGSWQALVNACTQRELEVHADPCLVLMWLLPDFGVLRVFLGLQDGGQGKAADMELWYALQFVAHFLNNDLYAAAFLHPPSLPVPSPSVTHSNRPLFAAPLTHPHTSQAECALSLETSLEGVEEVQRIDFALGGMNVSRGMWGEAALILCVCVCDV